MTVLTTRPYAMQMKTEKKEIKHLLSFMAVMNKTGAPSRNVL